MVYIIAFIGIMDTVLKQPVSAFLATSGVLAIVLGLALQSTLADVFSGLAINIERPFGAGDWITLNDIRTAVNDMVVIPNSVIAKAIVANHRKLNQSYLSSFTIKIDSSVDAARVIRMLESAASSTPGVAADGKPTGYAYGFSDSLVDYRLYFGVEGFERAADVLSQVIIHVTDALRKEEISIGSPAIAVKILTASR